MKIETSGFNRLTPAQPENTPPVGRARLPGKGETTGAERSDEAALSAQARLLGKARAALAEVSEVRDERVNQLRAQIQAGEYQVPFERLAGRLLRSVAYG
jgi:flagellar biosynthesis anti-sigma factor FlgM